LSVTTATSGCPVDRFRRINLPERSIQKCHLRESFNCIQVKSSGYPKISITSANSTKPKFRKIFHLSDSTSNELLTALVLPLNSKSKLFCPASALSESRSEDPDDQVPNPVKNFSPFPFVQCGFLSLV
jgi:hypothetical protein